MIRAVRERRGFSLLEVMISLAIVGAAVGGAAQLLAGQLHQVSRQEAMVERQQEGRAALAVLARELRLAGFPPSPDPACHAMGANVEADASAVRLLANLYGVITVLAAPASAGDASLRIPTNEQIREEGWPASPGAAFAENDVIYLHDPGRAGDPDDDRVECHRLERAGRSGAVSLAAGDAMRRDFPAGARVLVVNLVRYAHAPSSRQLMRAVDGASQSAADHVAAVHFSLQAGRIEAEMIFDPVGPAGRSGAWRTVAASRNTFFGP